MILFMIFVIMKYDSHLIYSLSIDGSCCDSDNTDDDDDDDDKIFSLNSRP